MLTEKDYCDYETCVALKELGFPQDYIFARYAKVDKLVDCTYHKRGDLIISEDRFAFTLESESIVAPLLYEAQKWMREEFGMLVDSMVFDDNSIDADGKVVDRWIYYSCATLNTSTAAFIRSYDHSDEYDTYEEALSEGIKETVKLLKKIINNFAHKEIIQFNSVVGNHYFY